MKKAGKKAGRFPIVRTVVSGILIVALVAVMVAGNMLIPENKNVINAYLGDTSTASIILPDSYTEDLDLEYNKCDYTPEEMEQAEHALGQKLVGEGVVLLKNEDHFMPFGQNTTFSFFGRSSTKIVSNALYDVMLQMGFSPNPGETLNTAFTAAGFKVNQTLWDFYDSGNGSSYGLGPGSVRFGESEDFSINECPLSELKKESGLLDSAKNTVPVFVWARKVGEGRDMPRSMYHHTSVEADKSKSYLEPDSVELELLRYLNDNYDSVVLLVNSSAAMELDWVAEFPNIKSVVYVASMGTYGMFGLADVFSGAVSPSGHTVDTFAANAFSSPAAQNYGDYQYVDESGAMTDYNYVTYKEGIYVGYRYYETRYEDVVLSQGNAGNFDYGAEVVYPFGYGLSYTDFEWSGYKTAWDGDICTVTLTVKNVGGVAGKDVVQIYAQVPYTDYDRENNVEKASVVLVGFAKTETLQPNDSETVAVQFNKSQLASYDYVNAKTYILDAGEYYITAGSNAHSALNNILAYKGYTVDDGMTEDGNSSLVTVYDPGITETVDSKTYAVDAKTGVAITNQFDFADSGCTYLSRKDWTGTFPTHDGEVSDTVSTWGNEVNGGDGVPYVYTKSIDAEGLSKLQGSDSLSPVDNSTLKDTPVYGKNNDVVLCDLRGLDYDDPLWDKLLDQLTPEEYQTLISASGYGTIPIEKIGKNTAIDQDAATGLTSGGTGVSYCGVIVLAQTWNSEMAGVYGEMIGNQALIGGCSGWYAPAMNIHRTPFSGRNNEYYSEDSFLSGAIASVTSRGAASKGLYTFIKHFVLNDQENHRGDRYGQMSIATWANEQSIREIYLYPFQMCIQNEPIQLNYVEQQADGSYQNTSRDFSPVTGLMTSFNRLGYTWAGGCYPLLTQVLRNEWGFKGFVITDNANTASSTFMNDAQMLEAGGDAALTTVGYVTWTFDEKDPVAYHYGRTALHNILYTVANSKLTNGQMPGSKVVIPVTIAEKIVIAINAAGALLTVLLALNIFLGIRKWKKQTAVKIEITDKPDNKAEKEGK